MAALSKVERAKEKYPEFDWTAYNAALSRQASQSKRFLAPDRNRRLTQATERNEAYQNEDQKMTDVAVVTKGKELIESVSDYDEFKEAVFASYGNNKAFQAVQLRALAKLSHQYGLNPNPGLDLIYMWEDKGKVFIHISYKGWLALGHRYKEFVHKTTTLDSDEIVKRGGKAGDITVACEVIDFEVVEKVKRLKEAGLDVDVNDYKIVGVGTWLKGTNTPNGRDGEWQAKKRAIKDAMVQLLVNQFNIDVPSIDGMYYDHDSDSFVIENDSGNIVEGTVSDTPAPEVIEPPKVEPAPRVVRNGKPGDGKPSYTVIEETPPQPIEPETVEDDTEPSEPVEDVVFLSESQVGEIRGLIRKSLGLGYDTKPETLSEIENIEAEICYQYEVAGGLEKVPAVYHKAIVETLKKTEKKSDKPAATADRPRTKDDATIDPDEYDRVFELVKEYLTKQDGWVEMPDDELKKKVEHQMLTFSGASGITVMNKRHVEQLEKVLNFEQKQGKKN